MTIIDNIAIAEISKQCSYWFFIPVGLTIVMVITLIKTFLLNRNLKIAQKQVRRHEEEISRSRGTLQTIIDAMPVGMMVVGPDKKIRHVNEFAMKISGYKNADELIGHVCHKTLCPAQEGHCPVFDFGHTLDMSEKILVAADGRKVPILKSAVLVELGGEEVLLETFIDISERKEAEKSLELANRNLVLTVEKLEDANNQLRDLVFAASHDLREPMRKIFSFGHLLRNSLGDKLAPDDKENLDFIMEGANKMTRMIGGLLDYSKIINKINNTETINVARTVHQICSLELADKVGRSSAQIEIPQPIPDVEVESAKFRELMLHLLSNAIKYHKKDIVPHVIITSKQESDGMVRIEVTDNGIGISPEYYDKIFAMFRRLHSTNEYEGTGIGLAICKKIVEHHDGRIGVESEPGKGATFWFTIPSAGRTTDNIELSYSGIESKE